MMYTLIAKSKCNFNVKWSHCIDTLQSANVSMGSNQNTLIIYTVLYIPTNYLHWLMSVLSVCENDLHSLNLCSVRENVMIYTRVNASILMNMAM